MQDKFNFSDDQPKENPWLHDRLGFAPLAKHVANVILKMDKPNGYAIGLNGKWGSGKTTFMNFVWSYIDKYNQEHETKDGTIVHIPFKPWIVSGHQDLMAAFFKQLSEHLDTEQDKKKWALFRYLSRFTKNSDKAFEAVGQLAILLGYFSPAAGVLTKLTSGMAADVSKAALAKFSEAPSLQSAYDKARRALGMSKRRFLVTIDDIDRLTDDEIFAVLQMVKTIGALPNLIYILIYDREIVEQAVDKNERQKGPSFLEKIIQHEIALTQPSELGLQDMFLAKIYEIIPEFQLNPRLRNLLGWGNSPWLESPRNILRYVNALQFSFAALHGELDLDDLFAMEGIRLFEPMLFDWIRNNKDFLLERGNSNYLTNNEKKAFMGKFKDKWAPDDLVRYSEILSLLFPIWAQFGNSGEARYIEPHELRANRRGIASLEGYESYFSMYPSSDTIPKSVIDDFFGSLDDENKLKQYLLSYMSGMNRRGESMISVMLRHILNRFNVEILNMPTLPLLKAVISVGEQVVKVKINYEYADYPMLHWRRLIDICLKIRQLEYAGQMLKQIFEVESSVFTLADIYGDRGRELQIFPSDVLQPPLISLELFQELGPILLSKIHSAVDDSSLQNAPLLCDIFTAWRYLENADAVNDWAKEQIKKSAAFTVKVARRFVMTSSSGNEYQYEYIVRDNGYDFEREYLLKYAECYLEEQSELTGDERYLLTVVVQGIKLRLQQGASIPPETMQ